MKTIKLLLIAIVVIAAIVGISALLKKCGGGITLSEAQVDKKYTQLSEAVELKDKTWSDSSWTKEYKRVKDEIELFRQYAKIRSGDAKILGNKLDESYKLILEKGATAAIKNCQSQVFAQLQNEMDSLGGERFKSLYTSVKNYRESLSIVSKATSLRDRPIENEYPLAEANSCLNRAGELRKDTLIMQCATIQDRLNLWKLNQILSDSHYEFLSKKVSNFLNTDFGNAATKYDVMKTANPILNEIKEYNNVNWYVNKRNTKELTSALDDFITKFDK